MPRGKPFVFLSLLFIFAAFFPSQYCAAGTDSRKVNRDSLYLFNDEMFVNNIPRDIDYPFYSDENNGFNVYQFNPQADHVYINNLKLKFRPNDLAQEDAYFWANRKISGSVTAERADSFGQKSLALDKLNFSTTKLWSYDLPADNLKDFYFDMRQWVKKYEESPLYCEVYNGAVILRNEYRVFCLDLLTKQKLWSLADKSDTGEEYLKTSRSPHQDAYGNEFLLAQGVVFTELNGKLIAIKVSDILKPEVLWKVDLGEYTLCAKPVKMDKTVVVGLINAREEIWFTGFNADNGKPEWNTYIGISSVLSPLCTLSAQIGERIFVGTNHGVLACLSAEKGRILWLRKYALKNYSILDFWEKGYFKDKISDQRSLSYDTQFMVLGMDKTLYYKPRESEYLYALDPASGKLKNQTWFDPEKSYLLAILNGKRVVLDKSASILNIYDMNSASQARRFDIKGGQLRGVSYPASDELLFKTQENLYLLNIVKDKINFKQIDASCHGWLLNSYGRFIFTGDNNTLTCADIFGHNDPLAAENADIAKLLKQREKAAEDLSVLLKRSPRDPSTKAKINKVIYEIASCGLPLEKIFPLIEAQIKNLRDPAWKDFLSCLKNNYGDEVVEYKGVKTRLMNFLYGFGLTDSPFKSANIISQLKSGGEKLKKYDISSANIALVPLNIIKGPRLLDFYLILDKDQLICARESGQVLWIRRICCGNHFSNAATSYYEHFEGIQVYLYNNVMIINDFTNIVAVNADSGAYLWSIADLKSKSLHTGFLGDKFVLVNGNKLFTVDPVSGVRSEINELKDSESQLKDVYFDKDHVYALAADLSKIQVFNAFLQVTRTFPLSFVDKEISDQIEWFFSGKYIILHNGFNIYLINKETGRLENKISIKEDVGFSVKVANPNDSGWVISSPPDQYWYCVEVYKDTLLVIAPFQRLTAYSLDASTNKAKWVQKMRIDNGFNIYKLVAANYRDLKTYFIGDGYLLLPFIAYNKIFITSVDIDSGAVLWKTMLKPAVDLFCMLRAVKESAGVLDLMISTVDLGETSEERTVLAEIDSEIFKVNSKNGVVLQAEKLPSVCEIGFRKSSFVQTQNWVLYNMHMNKIKAVRKDEN